MARKKREEARCHACGQAMVRDVRPMTFEYKGREFEVSQPAWYCECGESLMTGEDAAVGDAELERVKAEVDRLLSPEQVKAIRLRLGLTQVEAGGLLGGGPRAFHKYESGQNDLTRSMHNLLLVLNEEPRLLDVLRGAKLTKSEGSGLSIIKELLLRVEGEAKGQLVLIEVQREQGKALDKRTFDQAIRFAHLEQSAQELARRAGTTEE